MYTARALYCNAFGGKLDKKPNAALLRIVSVALYKTGDVPEARKALKSSLHFEEDKDTREFLNQIGSSPEEPGGIRGRIPSKFSLANASASLFIVSALAMLLWFYNSQPSGYEEKFKAESPAVVASAAPVTTKKETRDLANRDADELADIVHAHARIVGHHRQGSADVTDYELDRTKFSPNDFDPLVQKLRTTLASTDPNADGFISSVYFNARLMQLSVPIVNNQTDLKAVRSDVQEVVSLGDQPEIARWLTRSKFAAPYEDLKRALRDAELAQLTETKTGSRSEMEQLRSQAEDIEKQIAKASDDRDEVLGDSLRQKHHQIVVRYNRWVDAHNHRARANKKLDVSFNRCLDTKILMSRFNEVSIGSGQTDDEQQ